MKRTSIMTLAMVLAWAAVAHADGVVRGTVKRLNGIGSGNSTPKVEVSVAPESPTALPDGTGNCQLAKNVNPPSDGVTLYLMPSNPQYKSILAILMTAATTKKIIGAQAIMNNGSCFIENAYAEF